MLARGYIKVRPPLRPLRVFSTPGYGRSGRGRKDSGAQERRGGLRGANGATESSHRAGGTVDGWRWGNEARQAGVLGSVEGRFMMREQVLMWRCKFSRRCSVAAPAGGCAWDASTIAASVVETVVERGARGGILFRGQKKD